MSIITLTTDWQTRDYYSGMIKGRLLRLMPDAVIVEINQHIEPFHILQASFVLRQVLPEYPEGTIHLFLVNQGHRPGIWPAVAQYKSQFLVGWDDGILALIMDADPDYYLRLDHAILHNMDHATGIEEQFRLIEPSFPELSLFTRIAKYLSAGLTLTQAGPHSVDSGCSNSWLPVIKKDQIDGQVIFIDSYRNAITNIPKTEFIRIGSNRTFEITIKSNRYKIYGIRNTYLESEPGELLAIFNAAGLLEIAIVQGNAAELLGFEPGTPIKIRFDEQ
ncbi:MAG: SAM-dependent chlorinase/fluorinase [Bacteroidia bacterium]|nr:SAM-dependent chlorinase/fluorinase [Bacteroidia bacterium]